MDDEQRMEKVNTKEGNRIEWAGIQYNEMLPHEIKKFLDLRLEKRSPILYLKNKMDVLQPGKGIKLGPFPDDEQLARGLKSAQNALGQKRWPEGYNLGSLTDDDGTRWIVAIRGAKPKLKNSYKIIME